MEIFLWEIIDILDFTKSLNMIHILHNYSLHNYYIIVDKLIPCLALKSNVNKLNINFVNVKLCVEQILIIYSGGISSLSSDLVLLSFT